MNESKKEGCLRNDFFSISKAVFLLFSVSFRFIWLLFWILWKFVCVSEVLSVFTSSLLQHINLFYKCNCEKEHLTVILWSFEEYIMNQLQQLI